MNDTTNANIMYFNSFLFDNIESKNIIGYRKNEKNFVNIETANNTPSFIYSILFVDFLFFNFM